MVNNTTLTNIGIPVVSNISNKGIDNTLTEQDREILSKLPMNNALLISKNVTIDTSRFLLDTDETTIGRLDTSNIFLDDYTVSRKHCLIKRSENKFEIVDEDSLNGTYVNSELIKNKELKNLDIIQIGKYKYLFLQREGE